MGEPKELANGWYQYLDASDRPYFYNTITEVTQWEMPEELEDFEDGEEEYEEEEDDDDAAPTNAFAEIFLRETDAGDSSYHEEPETTSFHPPQKSRGTVQSGLSEDASGKSQFADAMLLLRKQGVFDGNQPEEKRERSASAVARRREVSQFSESLKTLKGLGVDGPGAAAVTPPTSHYASRASTGSVSGLSPSGLAEEFMVTKSSEPDQSFEQYMSAETTQDIPPIESPPELAAVSDPVPQAEPEPATEPEAEPEVAADWGGDSEATVSPELAELLAPQSQIPPSHPSWDTVTFQAVVFVWYESNGASRTEPLFPGPDGNLQVGPIHVAWDGLIMNGPGSSVTTTIPYENIVMWTLHLEETCLDLTLDGTFKPENRSIQWWTGSVLELRCCLSSTDATVNLGNKIKEVCMKKAKETKATDLNKSAIAAAAATLSHQVNTTTPTQRRASLSRKVSVGDDPVGNIQAAAKGGGNLDGYWQEVPGEVPPPPEQKEKKKKGMVKKIFGGKSKKDKDKEKEKA